MTRSAAPTRPVKSDPRLPAVLFGVGIGVFVLLLLEVVVNVRGQSDFPREAWAPYRALFHGHLIGFLQSAPAYVGSLILRAPFALAARALGGGAQATYIATALPCVIAPALLAGSLVSVRHGSETAVRRQLLWPLDLFMFTPAAIICITEGHPEDILGAVLCVAAVLLAQRGSARAAGIMLGLALINKPWAAVAAPLVVMLMPSDRRLAGFGTTMIVTGLVMVPVLIIRFSSAGGAALATTTGHQVLIPQLLWFFGPDSWVDREGHVILVLAGWLLTAGWWTRVRSKPTRPSTPTVLLLLVLLFFLRAVLDPWDNGYYFVPFMLALMTYEEHAGGFPKLSLGFAVMLVVVVPPAGPLNSLGNDGHAAVFAIWALAVIAFFGRRAFAGLRGRTQLYAAASRSGA